MVVGSIGVGGVGAGMSPGFPAFVAQRAVSVVVLPSGNTETEESRHVDRVPGTAVRAQVQACVQACVMTLSRDGRIRIRRIVNEGVL